jgi:hypothetical protein
MHAEAKEWIDRMARALTDEMEGPIIAVDLGGRETNGHARDVFGPYVHWTVVDAVDGPGVDVVANATTWQPDACVDLVLCAEVFEHTPYAPAIVANAYEILCSGGVFITTMAGPGREVHGVNHDDPDSPGYYQNVDPMDLTEWLLDARFGEFGVDENTVSHDVYGWARR